MKNLILILILNIFMFNSYALEVPKGSKYDTHIQSLNYNAKNVTEVKVKTGYVTAVSFNDDEVIENISIGFNDGWEATQSGNKIFLKAIGYKIDNKDIIEPNSYEWATNMLVTTNKRFYVFNLTLLDSYENNDKKDNAFLINFNYPFEIKKEKEQKEKEIAENLIKEKQADYVKKWLDFSPIESRNWDYFMQIGKGAKNITPDFIYDDGVRTFIGFSSYKKIPAIFGYEGDQEVMTNISTRNVGEYTVVLVHNIYNKMIFRSGNQVIGITNKSYGKIKTNNYPVINNRVERVIK